MVLYLKKLPVTIKNLAYLCVSRNTGSNHNPQNCPPKWQPLERRLLMFQSAFLEKMPHSHRARKRMNHFNPSNSRPGQTIEDDFIFEPATENRIRGHVRVGVGERAQPNQSQSNLLSFLPTASGQTMPLHIGLDYPGLRQMVDYQRMDASRTAFLRELMGPQMPSHSVSRGMSSLSLPESTLSILSRGVPPFLPWQGRSFSNTSAGIPSAVNFGSLRSSMRESPHGNLTSQSPKRPSNSTLMTTSLRSDGSHPPVVVFMDCDTDNLSKYQCLLRKQLELFEA